MKIEIRDRWVKALRSGEYEQGQGQLKDGNRFCCLGVLCDVVGLDWDTPERYGMDGGVGLGPEVLLSMTDYDDRAALATANDDGGKTFAELADWIEANIPVEGAS